MEDYHQKSHGSSHFWRYQPITSPCLQRPWQNFPFIPHTAAQSLLIFVSARFYTKHLLSVLVVCATLTIHA